MLAARLAKPSGETPVNAVVLLVTRDRDLLLRIVGSSNSDSLAIDHLKHVSEVNRRLESRGVMQVLAVDLTGLQSQEFEELRVLMASPDLPVLVVANEDDPAMQARLLAEGAQDVLLKSTLSGSVLRRAARIAAARKAREMAMLDDRERARASLASVGDAAEADALTTLPNRALLNDRLERCIALSRRHSRLMAVLLINLDHFKKVNDSLGHLAGDHILRSVAQRINSCIRHSDTVSRHAGDGFIVLLSEVHRAEDAAAIAEKIRLSVMEPYTIDSHYWQLTASIGISVYPNDGETAFALTGHAETAMYHAKEKGRNNSQFFKDDINARAEERKIIMEDLRHALMRGEFFLVFQPKINLLKGQITGFEALIRWRHPTRDVLYPAAFIPFAEECGLIIPIGEWVLHEACARARRWLDAGLEFETVAVNVSAVEFRSDSLFDGVCRILRTTGLPPRFLELEITETAVMRDLETSGSILRDLSAMGVRIAVDDFGTGYTNLSYLKRFPINTLKLDRSFIHDLPESKDLSIIVSSVIRMAHGLQLKVIGEGVETIEQLQFLKAHACEEAQGFYFSKPLEEDDCRSLLQQTEPHWFKQFPVPSLSAPK